MTIPLRIPQFAVDLILRKTPQACFDDMMTNGGVPFQEMVTFGHVITPIVDNDTGAEVAYVVHWHNGQVSVNSHEEPENNFLRTVGIDKNWGRIPPSTDEALEIFYRYVPQTSCQR